MVKAVIESIGTGVVSARKSGAGRVDACVYIDSPMPNAFDQVLPFYETGFFDARTVPVFLRNRGQKKSAALTQGKLGLPSVHAVAKPEATTQYVNRTGIIFYPFSAQANSTLVADRSLHHVLTLHGESNKVSSFKPGARLYDYVLVAGELACRRYLRAGIFTQHEVDAGRLVKVGDTLVQSLPYLQPCVSPAEEGWLVYAPTWESTTANENYSSAEGGYGFSLLPGFARKLGVQRILIKPHPNFGMSNIDYLFGLVKSIRSLKAAGYDVRVLDDAINWRIRLALRLSSLSGVLLKPEKRLPVALALVDVSGMEAICLKQRIPHMVVRKKDAFGERYENDLHALYEQKAFIFGATEADAGQRLTRYMSAATSIDAHHRDLVFSYENPDLPGATTQERYHWLCDYIRRDPFWARNH